MTKPNKTFKQKDESIPDKLKNIPRFWIYIRNKK